MYLNDNYEEFKYYSARMFIYLFDPLVSNNT